MKDAKGHGSNARGGLYQRPENRLAGVMAAMRARYLGTHGDAVHSATAGKALPQPMSAMDRAIADIQREFSGPPKPRGQFGPNVPLEGSPNPSGEMRIVQSEKSTEMTPWRTGAKKDQRHTTG
jgi:hypothetical protein